MQNEGNALLRKHTRRKGAEIKVDQEDPLTIPRFPFRVQQVLYSSINHVEKKSERRQPYLFLNNLSLCIELITSKQKKSTVLPTICQGRRKLFKYLQCLQINPGIFFSKRLNYYD